MCSTPTAQNPPVSELAEFHEIRQPLAEKLRRLKLLAVDVDGTLTDGSLYLGEGGEVAKRFNSQDGYGIHLALTNGLRIAFITGRDSPVVARRARELEVEDLYLDCSDKLAALRELAEKHHLSREEIGFVGDDLPDAAVFSHVGAGIAVANATPATRTAADYVTARRGGEGAVREVIELVFQCQGTWEDLVARTLEGRQP